MITTLVATVLVGVQSYFPSGPQIEVTMKSGKKFVITTDPKNSPKTVKRIMELVKKKFYDGQKFHRVEGWVVQWGDPVSRTDIASAGRSGSGVQMEFEGSVVPFNRGTVGIASTGMRVGGDSQLFVIKNDASHLNTNYAALGKVTVGMDVVDGIQVGDQITKMTVLAAKKAKK